MSCASATCSPIPSFPAAVYARPGFFAFPWREFLRTAIEAVARASARRGQRCALLELDDHLLADVGVTREQARHEARKRFWQ
jgi:uncharacterized protein YjiS (DUF1127 family)